MGAEQEAGLELCGAPVGADEVELETAADIGGDGAGSYEIHRELYTCCPE